MRTEPLLDGQGVEGTGKNKEEENGQILYTGAMPCRGERRIIRGDNDSRTARLAAPPHGAARPADRRRGARLRSAQRHSSL